MYWIVGIILVCCVLGAAVWASASIRSGVYLRSLCRGDSPERAVCLTFDDGPDPQCTPKLLDLLKRHGLQATFFLIGKKAQAHPELVRRMVDEGHTIGNHTWSHSARFPLRGERFVREEVERGAKAVGKAANLAGSKRIKLFRPPFGVTNPIIGRVVRSEGYCSIGWSIRSFDTVASTPRQKVLSRVLRKLHPGAVILLHDRCEGSVELLERLLAELSNRGYEVWPIEKMLKIEAYENQ